jgi:hypothetical protein
LGKDKVGRIFIFEMNYLNKSVEIFQMILLAGKNFKQNEL